MSSPSLAESAVYDFQQSFFSATWPQIACRERPINTTVTRHLIQETTSDLMTSPEAATYLSISKGTLRHWVSDQKIEFVKLGRAVRFRKARLDRFISQKLQKKHSRS